MNNPVATERKSFLPLRLRAPATIVGSRPTIPMPSVAENNNKSLLTVGNRVVVNGLKNGTLRYIGIVQFAQGIFCGIELDQPDGKHDGEVKDIRYFQCASNHGIFVPRDKVILAPRPRTLSSQRPVSRLKPPTMTRSITIPSSINNIEQTKPVQLPDIVPNRTTPQPVILNEPIVNDNHAIEQTINIVETQSSPIDEQTIEADFTDSVSIILHKLQLEEEQQKQQIPTRTSSVVISEEDDTDDDDELDNESIAESILNGELDKTCHSSTSSVFIPMDLTKYVQTDLSFHSNDNISFNKVGLSIEQKQLSNSSASINKLKINSKDNKNKIPVTIAKKNIERRPVAPLTNTTKRESHIITPRKPTIIIPKKGPTTRLLLPSANSVNSLGSRSKLNLSVSSSNSVNSSQSDLRSITPSLNQNHISDINRKVSQSIDLSSSDLEKQLSESRHNLNELDHQLIIQKDINQSLEIHNERFRKQYQHLLNQFDLMYILNQYCITETAQNQQQHELQLSKARTTKDRLETIIEQLQLSHKNELTALNKQHQSRIETLTKTHEQQLNECQKKNDNLLSEKNELECRCTSLQEKVDSHLAEMANSEHADALLCHVETLEKDRTSLQTVLEMKKKELAQLRTKLNEQVFQLEDKIALQKRIDAAENRNQDLEYCLQIRRMNENTTAVERDELKEQVVQLERDNCQLKFENETLLYRLRQRSLSFSITTDNPKISSTKLTRPKEQVRKRACSLPLLMTIVYENERLTRSLSLNCILNR